MTHHKPLHMLLTPDRTHDKMMKNDDRTGSTLKRQTNAAACFLAAAMFASCAANNYDFGKDAMVDVHSRAASLASDLAEEESHGAEDSLHDFSYIPLAHLDMHVFSEEDDDRYPGGYVEADVESYLPLLAFVDAKITRYDKEHSVYEQHEFNSYLWGLFATHREEIATPRGMRKTSTHRLLWFIPWGGSPKYDEIGE